MILEQLAGVLLCLLSFLMLCFPRKIWRMTEAWKNDKAATPSKAYVVVLRCAGTVFLITGLIVFFIL